jgi:DNA-binding transcriptional regulator YiaG
MLSGDNSLQSGKRIPRLGRTEKMTNNQLATRRGRDAATGAELRAARVARKMTQRDVARKLGVCERTIRYWEELGIPETGLARWQNVERLLNGDKQ